MIKLTIAVVQICFVLNSFFFQQKENVNKVALPRITPVILQTTGNLSFEPINESSGIVKSRKYKDVFWTHNDSGDEPRIIAITSTGEIIKPNQIINYSGIIIKNARNVDWEDIATDDRGNLIIGDCGNNSNNRRDLAFYIIPEPSPYVETPVKASVKIPFHYPDQKNFPPQKRNFDAEAVFYAHGKIHLLTKHRSDHFTKLYRLDSMNIDKSNPLTFIDKFEIEELVTSADVSEDGKKLVVLTRNAIWLFEVKNSTDNYFSGKIYYLPIHAKQCEAICFFDDKILITNEQRDVYELPIDKLVLLKDS